MVKKPSSDEKKISIQIQHEKELSASLPENPLISVGRARMRTPTHVVFSFLFWLSSSLIREFLQTNIFYSSVLQERGGKYGV